ncbi:hypothetical protein M011DRAFT_467159 [Sporormia fimetaria CBS 119925]|uniref:RING-type E3 ubiquitin transferase n=1 Tax=Sporormia fimetaria CBS 119925 TaxID=1340428 RepID=A0A6A6VEY0_9PLEO|nr:hypothetical protein M011DRAFT_467159 [Sporormia fimetaria CBS 119925]
MAARPVPTSSAAAMPHISRVDSREDGAAVPGADSRPPPRHQDDGDTCRICRGEGTAEEPLFYPCKCSGSIRFVHQDCLMEWLSHSQKKYCELCKTPFRFTKLYHPEMPTAVPTNVFLRRALWHVFRSVVTWCRAFLVGLIWIIALPYCVRLVWRTLFFLADGGWARPSVSPKTTHTAMDVSNSPSNVSAPSLAPQPKSTASTAAHTLFTFVGRLFLGPVFELVKPAVQSAPVSVTTATNLDLGQPSLLSELPWLQWFPSKDWNRVLVDVVEGQLITVLIVIAFILIFLIREWVIQQRPLMQIPELAEQRAAALVPGPIEILVEENSESEDEPEEGMPSSANAYETEKDVESQTHVEGLFTEDPATTNGNDGDEGPVDSAGQQRPNMPSRERSFIATEIRRDMEEGDPRLTAGPSQPIEGKRPIDGVVPESWEDEEKEGGSEHSSESWQQIQGVSPHTAGGVENLAKGKERAVDQDQHEHDTSNDSSSSPPSSTFTGTDVADAPKSPDNPGGLTQIDESEEQGESGLEPFPPFSSFPHLDPESAVPNDTELEVGETEPEVPDETVQPPLSVQQRLLEWMFIDIAHDQDFDVANDDNGEDDEHVVQDPADEAPFVPFADNEPRAVANGPVRNVQNPGGAGQAGGILNDQDAVDDAEDLEGILELIGMQGPVVGLFQNALFVGVLISATLAFAVWIPYMWGKVVLLLVGNPMVLLVKIPLRVVASTADLIVDAALWLAAETGFYLAKAFQYTGLPVGSTSWVAERASVIINSTEARMVSLLDIPWSPHADQFYISANSHAALRAMQESIGHAVSQLGRPATILCNAIARDFSASNSAQLISNLPLRLWTFVASSVPRIPSLLAAIWASRSYQITLNLDFDHADVIRPDQAVWTLTDRCIAVLAGYSSFTVAGMLYMKKSSPFSDSEQGQKIETVIREILQQAGGVLKVVLIISIEMLVFPLYCGLLLDLALLPAFQGATLQTRWLYATQHPWRSTFVHWFIGTCYMFHFALFVTMCRRIMRKGVLYFIRDPDDPTFHPVRDVLERSVATQLRKIAFSAVVYGALVIVCLGGVVWSLQNITTGILPIHWTADAPQWEFPLGLFLYHYFLPFFARAFEPGERLNELYEWWFRSCASFLRLTNFLFGDTVLFEQGHHVRRTWRAWLLREEGDTEHRVEDDSQGPAADSQKDVFFQFDGKFVRAPASDQTRIPRGVNVFVEVDKSNNRADGRPDEGVHASNLFEMVYIPPYFRIRVGLFIFAIWVFAAMTGVCMTMLPLLVGRSLLATLSPAATRNDIHAFSLGIYSVAGLVYIGSGVYTRTAAYLATSERGQDRVTSLASVGAYLAKRSLRLLWQVLRAIYVWTSLLLIVPLLVGTLLQVYIFMPLHGYTEPDETHVIHIVRYWTLNLVLIRLAGTFLFFGPDTRLYRASYHLVAGGICNPNARIATRCFLLPTLTIFTAAMALPTAVAYLLSITFWADATPETRRQLWRACFPLVGLLVMALWVGRLAVLMLGRWKRLIRDEVYLIGERLHNFGDKGASRGQEVPDYVPRRYSAEYPFEEEL